MTIATNSEILFSDIKNINDLISSLQNKTSKLSSDGNSFSGNASSAKSASYANSANTWYNNLTLTVKTDSGAYAKGGSTTFNGDEGSVNITLNNCMGACSSGCSSSCDTNCYGGCSGGCKSSCSYTNNGEGSKD